MTRLNVKRGRGKRTAHKRASRAKRVRMVHRRVGKLISPSVPPTIGCRMGLRDWKRETTVDTFVTASTITFASRTLNSVRLTDLSLPDGSDAISVRQRDIVNCRSIQLQMFVRNLKQNEPINLRFAVVANRSAGASATSIGVTEFFRSYGTTRAVDFGIALSSLELMKNPINTDRYFVMRDFTLKLNENSITTASQYNKQFGTAYQWQNIMLKINKALQYAPGETACRTPLFLVWWSDIPGKETTAGVDAGQHSVQLRSVLWFQDP